MTPETKKHLEFVPEVDKHHRRRRDNDTPIPIKKLEALDVTANVSDSLVAENKTTTDDHSDEMNCHLGGPGTFFEKYFQKVSFLVTLLWSGLGPCKTRINLRFLSKFNHNTVR